MPQKEQSNAVDDGVPLSRPNIHKVAIVHTNVIRENYPTEQEYLSDFDVIERATDIKQLLGSYSYQVLLTPWNDSVVETIRNFSPDVIINMVETVDGDTLKASSAYETIATLRIPYTGIDAKTFVLNCYKDAFKERLLDNNVSTPAYTIVDSLTSIDSEKITPLLPAMVKLNTHRGGSIGMDETAICYTLEQVRTRCETIIKTFRSKALVEKYIKGKELTGIAIQRGNDIDVFVGQKVFSSDYSFCSWKAVWMDEDSYAYNGPYDDSDGKIRELCINGFYACGVTGYAKFDILVDQEGTPYIVDINPDCSLGRHDSAIDVVPSLFGREFEVSLFAIINTALKVNKQRALEVTPQKALYFHT